jgi:KDO2-lipid IV(A) lauroyltransferase
MAKKLPRTLAHPLEAAGAVLLYGVFRVLPVDVASAVGGFIGRTLGPRTAISRRADRNLQRAMPELDAAERARIVRGMWDNLGRVLAEYPHIPQIARERVEVVGVEHTEPLRGAGKAGILFGAHLGNWELFGLTARKYDFPFVQVYRIPNNPLIDRMMRKVRRMSDDATLSKGPAGARKALEVLKRGGRLGMLVDQKMNDGISAPFFGIEAMTAPAVAQLGMRFNCPVMPARIERLNGCRFRITAYPSMQFHDSGDRKADLRAAMVKINAMLEGWIRERPEQWLWVHRRWPG